MTDNPTAQSATSELGCIRAALLGWGGCMVFFQIPIVTMIVDYPRALYLSAWDWTAFAYLSLLLFVGAPVVAALIVTTLRMAVPRYVSALTMLAISYYLARQVDFFLLAGRPDVALELRIGLVVAIAGGLFWLLTKISTHALQFLVALAPVSVLLFAYFALMANPSKFVGSPPATNLPGASARDGVHSIFILTFEKLARAYLLDREGRMHPGVAPNLAAFVEEATVYPDAHSSSNSTADSLRTLYLGRLPYKVDVRKLANGLNILGAGRNVYFLNDVTTAICNPRQHECLTTLGANNDKRRWALILGYLRTYAGNVLPLNLIEMKLGRHAGWKFNPYIDMFEKEMASALDAEGVHHRLGQMESEILQNAIESETGPAVYVMHNFISDGVVSGYPRDGMPADQRASATETARSFYGPMDEEIGKILAAIRRRGIYDSSLILIASDTGYDPSFNQLLADREIATTDTFSNVFLAVKAPGQKTGNVVRSKIFYTDVLPTILALVGIDPSLFAFEGNPVSSGGPEAEAPREQFFIAHTRSGQRLFRFDAARRVFRPHK